MYQPPAPFTGSDEQAEANRSSHRWVPQGGETGDRCADCSANRASIASAYACGDEVPRVPAGFHVGRDNAGRAVLVEGPAPAIRVVVVSC